MQHLVSIIIPTYKRSTYLRRAINSVINQSYQNVEIIVVDDNNEGDTFRFETEKVMSSYKDFHNVNYIKHEKNKNGAAARNTGIRNAKGEYVGFLDDDDIFSKNKIMLQISCLEKLGEQWGGNFTLHVRRYKNATYKKINVEEKHDGDYLVEFLSGETSLPSSTLIFRKNALNNIGFFDESFIRHQDLEFLIRFFRKYKMSVVKSYCVFMQVEGFRNYPDAEMAHNIKLKFLNKFKNDIYNRPKHDIKKIIHYQWFDVSCFYYKELNISKANDLMKTYVLPNSKSYFKDFIKICFFLLSGIFPWFKKFYYYLIAKLYYNKLNTKI